MKSILFCTSYFGNKTAWDHRYLRWSMYYQAAGFSSSDMFFIDDGSPFTPLHDQAVVVDALAPLAAESQSPRISRFGQRLGRASLKVYPGWWRSFLHSVTLANAMGADKIIHIESDAFVLTHRLLDHILGLREGWSVLWATKFKMPETAIQVICKDQFPALTRFRTMPQCELDGSFAEHLLPFTHVAREFKGDRYSEIKIRRGIFRSRKFSGFPPFKSDFFWASIPRDADFATQVIPRQSLLSEICQETWTPPVPLPDR
jgi:hypothetical protein